MEVKWDYDMDTKRTQQQGEGLRRKTKSRRKEPDADEKGTAPMKNTYYLGKEPSTEEKNSSKKEGKGPSNEEKDSVTGTQLRGKSGIGEHKRKDPTLRKRTKH
jgi:hypothetical protein